MENGLETPIRSVPWDIRPANGEDISFIYATWLKSYRCDSQIGLSCRTSVFYSAYGRVIDQILETAQVLIACKANDPFVIFGYIVFDPGVVHYIFIKEAFWKEGIARSLIKQAIPEGDLTYSHRTRLIEPYLARHPELTYNPFLLFKQGDTHGTSQDDRD